MRQTVSEILRKSNPPPCNLTRSQKVALKELKNEKSIDVYPFDKGSGFVLIKHEDALKKIEEQIGHTKISQTDPTKTLITKFQIALRQLYKEKKLTKSLYKKSYILQMVISEE